MSHKAKKSFGQHFLVDDSVVKKIIDAAEITPGETVVEIGPGKGVLTQALVEAGAKVIAIEADRDLIEPLEHQFGGHVQLIAADALKIDSSVLPKDYKLVSNLPYNIASEVIERALSVEVRPSRLVVMVQKEVAERMLAKPPHMGVLSVAVQLYADVKRVTNVPPGAFRPMPNVDSAVVQLDLKDVSPDEIEPVIQIAKAGFRARRKQLHKNLAEAGITENAKTHLTEMGLDDKIRAEGLTPSNWLDLASRIARDPT